MIADYIENIRALFYTGSFSWIYFFCGAVFGSAMGSFADVVADRTLEGRKWWGRERSRCPACDKVLGPLELIPIISFIVQKRRCRGCGALIPYECLWAEISCALLYGVLWGLRAPLTVPWMLGSLLIPLFMVHIITDLKSFVLVDGVTLLIFIVALGARMYGGFISDSQYLYKGVLGSLIAGGGFLVFSIPGLVGFGDAVLMAGLGMVTGIYGVLFNIYAASLMAVFYYLFMTCVKCAVRKNDGRPVTLKDIGDIAAAGREIPYGPWLCLGAYLWIVFFM